MKLIEWLWLILIILAFFMFMHAFYFRLKHPKNKYYSLIASMSSCVMLWMVCEFMMQYSSNAFTIIIFHEAKYLLILSLPLLFFYHSYAVKTGNRIASKIIIYTSVVATVLFGFIITNQYHNLFRISLEVIFDSNFNLIHPENGILFYIVVLYSYTFIAIALSNFIIAFNNQPLMFRNRELKLIISIIIPVLFNFTYQIGHILMQMDFDPTPIGFFITVAIFYYHFLININKPNNISARGYMVDYMSTGMLYLNKFNHIYDANKSFLDMADSEISEIFDKPLSSLEKDIFRQLSNIKNLIDANASYENEYTYVKGSKLTTQQITFSEMKDRKGNYIGGLFTFNDITKLKETMAQLEFISIHDHLTKLKNRSYFDRILKEYNTMKHFPLGLIICDIQHLKNINDTKGYIAGDSLLVNIARRLEQLSPKKATTCRIGSSEFSIILPNTNVSEMNSLIDTLLQLCKQNYVTADEKSVKIGSAIKIDDKMNLAEFISQVSINTITQKY